jgi:hypothetical protein
MKTPKRKRPTHRDRVRQKNRRLREAAIDAAEAARTALPKDALERAVRNTPLSEHFRKGNPLLDPLFMPDAEFRRRESIMSQMDAYENSSTPAGFINHQIVDGANSYRADEFLVWQSRTAYELLKRGIDVRTIAAKIHRDVPWVENIARQFNITNL